jgi:hypothetical protein
LEAEIARVVSAFDRRGNNPVLFVVRHCHIVGIDGTLVKEHTDVFHTGFLGFLRH